MKIFFTCSLVVISSSILAQVYPSPEFAEKPMYYNLSTGELQLLERQIHPVQSSSGFNQNFSYKGIASPVHIRKSEGVQFLIKLVNTVEPDLILFLYPLTVSNGNRVIKIHVSLKDPAAQGQLPFQYKKVAENLYMLSVDNIEPGEYVWYLKSASYLFSVE